MYKNKENFALSSDDLSAVRNEINRIYDMDVEAIRNLGHISKSLLTGTNTFTPTATGTPGNLTIPANNTIIQGNTSVAKTLTFKYSSWGDGATNFAAGHIAAAPQGLMIVGNNPAGTDATNARRLVHLWDDVVVDSDLAVAKNLQVNGSITGPTINSLVATNTSLQNQINSLQNQINNNNASIGRINARIDQIISVLGAVTGLPWVNQLAFDVSRAGLSAMPK